MFHGPEARAKRIISMIEVKAARDDEEVRLDRLSVPAPSVLYKGNDAECSNEVTALLSPALARG